MRHEETTTTTTTKMKMKTKTTGNASRTHTVAAAALFASMAVAFAVATTSSRDAQAASAPEAKVTGKNFSLDFAVAGGDCKVGAECTATLKLEALGSFHINDNYPYKLKLAEVAGVDLLGKDAAGKNVFSKQAGDFKKDGEKAATLTVKFKPSKAGAVTLAGQYKMSVCSEANCQLETQEVSTTINVK